MLDARLLGLLAPLALGCKTTSQDGLPDSGPASDTAPAWRPDLVCPGDAGCASNLGPLHAGAAARDVTPPCFESWSDDNESGQYNDGQDPFFDCGCDRLCPGDPGYPGPDQGEGDGVFQPLWMAGFGSARAATGVHDPLWARALVVESGDTRVGIVVLDVVGWFYEDAQRVWAAAEAADLDLVLVQSTHNHEGPDTMGQWGPNLSTTGRNPAYQDFVVQEAAQALLDATAALTPATLTVVDLDTATPQGPKGTANFIRDSRDPVVIDEFMGVAHFEDSSGNAIATFMNWGNHAETLGSRNLLVTSDFPHYLRTAVEGGVAWSGGSVPGLGGVALFSPGSVGGMMTPLGATTTDLDGVDHSGDTFEKAEAIGTVLGKLVLEALAEAEPAVDPSVSLLAQEISLPVRNDALRLAHALGLFERELFGYDPDAPVSDDNLPLLRTHLSLVDIGPLRLLGLPGELLPELAVGGYDGSRVNSNEAMFLDPDNPNPPDLSRAPEGPYFKDLMGGRVNVVLGLANDEIGYLIPEYDYALDEGLPYLSEAEGDHYEETNSLGPEALPLLSETVEALTAWRN